MCLSIILSPCILPIEIEIRNTSWADSAEINLDLVDSSQSEFSSEFRTDFGFIGKSTFTDHVPAESSVKRVISAVFFSPGLYNINRWKLTVDLGQGQEMRSFIQTPSIQRYVSIIEK